MEIIVVITSLIILFYTVRNNRKNKLEFLYDTVIVPSYIIFYRASISFINQKGLSKEGKKEIKGLKTTGTDYILLLNNVKRCKNMFSKRSKFYIQLDIIEDRCEKTLSREWHTIYGKDGYEEIKEQIDALHSLYNKYNRFHHVIFDYPQL